MTTSKHRPRPARLLSTLAAFAAVGLAPAARATDYFWSGAGGSADETWGLGTNWSGGATPPSSYNNNIYFTVANPQGLYSNNNLGSSYQTHSINFNSSDERDLIGSSVSIGPGGNLTNNGTGGAFLDFDSDYTDGLHFNQGGNIFANAGGIYTGFNTNVRMEGTGGVTYTLNLYGGTSAAQQIGLYGFVTNGSAILALSIQRNAVVTLGSVDTYTGATTVSTGGELRLGLPGFYQVSANGSAFVLDPSGGTATVSLGVSNTISSALSVGAGNYAATLRTLAGLTSAATYGGNITLANNLVVADVGGQSLTISGTIASNGTTNRLLNVGSAASPNNGTVTFSGSNDNSYTGATVNSGTLVLAKTSSTNVHAVGSMLTVNSGAVVALGNNTGDQLYQACTLTLNAGSTFRTGGFSEGSSVAGSVAGVGTLTLAGTATVDFGQGANGSTLLAAAGVVTGTGTINIIDWTGTGLVDTGLATNDRLLFVANPNFSAAQLAQFQFKDDNGNNLGSGAQVIMYNGYYELVPIVVNAVPEPGTWATVALGLAGTGAVVLRRRWVAG